MTTSLTTVLTAETHRRVPAGCGCEWKQPWPGQPWVLVTPNPGCRCVTHRTLSQHAGRRKYWQMVADATETRIGELKAIAAKATEQLAKLGKGGR